MTSMVFRTRRSPSSTRRGRRVRALEKLRADGGGPDQIEVPGRVGPVVPLPNVGADAGPSRRVRVKTLSRFVYELNGIPRDPNTKNCITI